MDLGAYLEERRAEIEQALQGALPPRQPDPGRLVEAMRYTLLLPGKRLRGIVCLAVADLFGGRRGDVLPLAVAVEMVHAASLVLDDLPAFDDATRRRGAPASHLVFGEATAVLASIGLLSRAFGYLAERCRARFMGRDDAVGAVAALARAVGEDGMIAGEALDLAARDSTPGLEDLERIHALKTGSLFIACAVESARIAGAGPAERAALHAYAKNLGLAFQVVDDLLDATGDPDTIGKDTGRDRGGASFVEYAGVEGARRLADDLVETAIQSLAPLGRGTEVLEALARYVSERER